MDESVGGKGQGGCYIASSNALARWLPECLTEVVGYALGIVVTEQKMHCLRNLWMEREGAEEVALGGQRAYLQIANLTLGLPVALGADVRKPSTRVDLFERRT